MAGKEKYHSVRPLKHVDSMELLNIHYQQKMHDNDSDLYGDSIGACISNDKKLSNTSTTTEDTSSTPFDDNNNDDALSSESSTVASGPDDLSTTDESRFSTQSKITQIIARIEILEKVLKISFTQHLQERLCER